MFYQVLNYVGRLSRLPFRGLSRVFQKHTCCAEDQHYIYILRTHLLKNKMEVRTISPMIPLCSRPYNMRWYNMAFVTCVPTLLFDMHTKLKCRHIHTNWSPHSNSNVSIIPETISAHCKPTSFAKYCITFDPHYLKAFNGIRNSSNVKGHHYSMGQLTLRNLYQPQWQVL